MDKKTRKAIHQDIDNSSIAEEMKYMFLKASGLQSVVEHVYSRIKGVYLNNGYECKENEVLSGLADYCKAVKAASFHFYERIQPLIDDATWGVGLEDDENGNTVAFDGFAAKANELVRLDLNYLNAADPKKMYEAVFTVLRRNASKTPLFENKVISHYKMKM
jgi:hypothetical protein